MKRKRRKYSDEDIETIRNAASVGQSYRSLARVFDCDSTNIRRIVLREIYKEKLMPLKRCQACNDTLEETRLYRDFCSRKCKQKGTKKCSPKTN